MAEQDNRRLAREVFDAWNAHDPERLAKLIDEKYVAESDTLPAPIEGVQGTREFMNVYVTAFPDLHFDLDQMIAEGDFVTTRWTAAGHIRVC
jgi:predicted ester cyclase